MTISLADWRIVKRLESGEYERKGRRRIVGVRKERREDRGRDQNQSRPVATEHILSTNYHHYPSSIMSSTPIHNSENGDVEMENQESPANPNNPTTPGSQASSRLGIRNQNSQGAASSPLAFPSSSPAKSLNREQNQNRGEQKRQIARQGRTASRLERDRKKRHYPCPPCLQTPSHISSFTHHFAYPFYLSFYLLRNPSQLVALHSTSLLLHRIALQGPILMLVEVPLQVVSTLMVSVQMAEITQMVLSSFQGEYQVIDLPSKEREYEVQRVVRVAQDRRQVPRQRTQSISISYFFQSLHLTSQLRIVKQQTLPAQ